MSCKSNAVELIEPHTRLLGVDISPEVSVSERRESVAV